MLAAPRSLALSRPLLDLAVALTVALLVAAALLVLDVAHLGVLQSLTHPFLAGPCPGTAGSSY